jgi:hypothetical protein
MCLSVCLFVCLSINKNENSRIIQSRLNLRKLEIENILFCTWNLTTWKAENSVCGERIFCSFFSSCPFTSSSFEHVERKLCIPREENCFLTG